MPTLDNIPIVSRSRKLIEPSVRLPVIAELRLSEILGAARKLIDESEPGQLSGVARNLDELAKHVRAKIAHREYAESDK